MVKAVEAPLWSTGLAQLAFYGREMARGSWKGSLADITAPGALLDKQ
jgi:hypothetical protein